MHTHIEDGDPQLARGPCRLREDQSQVFGSHALWVTEAAHEQLLMMLRLRQSRSPPPGFFPEHTHPLQSARTLLGGTSAKLVQNPFRVGALTRVCRDGLGSSLLQRDQIHDQPNRQSSSSLPHAARLGPLQARHKRLHYFMCYLFPWEEQIEFRLQLGYGALTKPPTALFSVFKLPYLCDDLHTFVSSSGWSSQHQKITD